MNNFKLLKHLSGSALMAGKTIMSFRTLEIWEPINFYDFRMGSWNPLLKFDGFPGTRGTRACQVPDFANFQAIHSNMNIFKKSKNAAS